MQDHYGSIGWGAGAARWAITSAVGALVFMTGAPSWIGWTALVSAGVAAGMLAIHLRQRSRQPKRSRRRGRSRRPATARSKSCSARCRRSRKASSTCSCSCGGRSHGTLAGARNA